jgi:hypothetical protein
VNNKKVMTNYKLNDYAERLRRAAAIVRAAGAADMFEAQELEEIASVLEGMMHSPVRGS